ncbi:MAG TPA: LysR family transcriptional regulator [Candidatus Saccharimonadales bacterium]|nr:LysR family transcriptional regulator [Candidatus Saccharimonadales bacterium]
MDVSTDYLKTFVAVSECQSFSLAASRIHKSQGAISTQIAKLEEQARIQLIDRSQRNFKLTEAGEVFLVFARETLARADEIGKLFDQLNSGIKGGVKISATRSVGIYVLPDIMSAIAHEFPRLKLSLFTQSRVPTYEQLKKGELDLALVLSDSSPGGLVTKPLRSEPLCFVVSPRHPLAAKKSVSLTELNSTPFAIGIKGNEFSDMVDSILERKGIPQPTEGFTISNLQGRKEAARAGVGVAILPSFTVRNEIRDGGLKKLLVKGVQLDDTHLMLVEPARKSANPNVELVKSILEKHLQKPADEK